jgi:eukaryotic-like serine/threonine-protein kinase
VSVAERDLSNRSSELTSSQIRASAGGYARGDLVAGKYRIERLVGEGGMGQILAATHVDLGQEVAIKIMLAEKAKDADSVERFLREARAAVMLKSSHVARVFDVGTTESGLPYIVMELLDGKDLFTLMMENGALPYGEAVEALLHACDAVAEAHAHGIIHRDLKPENLFLTQRRDGTAIVKVLDFGISKIGVDPAAVRKGRRMVTQENTVLGSPSYMSPEQVRNSKRVDERSDIYSLGVTLFELLTAAEPFGGDSTPEIFVNVLTTMPVAPHLVVPAIPPELSAVVMRCIAKEPSARYQNVTELANALLPFSRGKPTSIAPSWDGADPPPDSALVRRLSTPNPIPVPPVRNTLAIPGTPQAFPVTPFHLTPQPFPAPGIEGHSSSSPAMPVSATIAETRASRSPRSAGMVIAAATALTLIALIGAGLAWRSMHRSSAAAAAGAGAAGASVAPPAVVGEVAAGRTTDDPAPASAPSAAAASASASAPASAPALAMATPIAAPQTTAAAGRGVARVAAPPPRAAPAPARPSQGTAPKPSALPRERTSW